MSFLRLGRAGLVLSGFFLFWPGSTARADEVDVELSPKAMEGQGKPALLLVVNQAVKSVNLNLQGSDGKRIRQKRGRLKSGTRQKLEIDAPLGVTHYTGSLDVTFDNGSTASMPLQFDVEVVGPFLITMPYERMDLKKGTTQFTLTRPAGQCEYEVLIEDKPKRADVVRFNGEPPGTWLTLHWRPYGPDDVVLAIRMLCWDAEHIFHSAEGWETNPWWIDIPHQDVHFETARWEILTSEKPKLDQALNEIQTVVKRYGQIVKVKLYVTGHTDSVGQAASNQTLSLNRARSIAAYFRNHGIAIPIWYLGFGEKHQAVVTADEVEEIRNRRAQYIVGVENPIPGRWRQLP